jgi:hypothetical protein
LRLKAAFGVITRAADHQPTHGLRSIRLAAHGCRESAYMAAGISLLLNIPKWTIRPMRAQHRCGSDFSCNNLSPLNQHLPPQRIVFIYQPTCLIPLLGQAPATVASSLIGGAIGITLNTDTAFKHCNGPQKRVMFDTPDKPPAVALLDCLSGLTKQRKLPASVGTFGRQLRSRECVERSTAKKTTGVETLDHSRGVIKYVALAAGTTNRQNNQLPRVARSDAGGTRMQKSIHMGIHVR